MKKINIIYKILLLILLFTLTECATSLPKNNKLLQHKWYGYGGAVIFDFQANHKFKSLMVENPQVSGTWQTHKQHIILSIPSMAEIDTLTILHLSKDSLFLNFAIKKFSRHLPSTGKNIKRKYSKEEIISHFSDKKFRIKENNTNQTTILFYKNGEYALDTNPPKKTYKWKIEPLGNYYFIVIKGPFADSFSRIVGISKDKIELEVYEPLYEKHYHLTLELLSDK